MTTGAIITEGARAPAKRRKAHRRTLVGAEILRLRRRRVLMITVAMLTLGVLVIVGGILTVLHVADPARYGPPGGASKLAGFSLALAELGTIAGILVGASAGSADLSAGVFRALVTTGRPRWALFLARVPGVLAIVVPAIVVTFAAICIYVVGLSFGTGEPAVEDMVRVGAWVLLDVCVYSLIALGFSAIVGSRSVTVAVLLATNLVVAQILSLPLLAFAGLRQTFFFVSLRYIMPSALAVNSGVSWHESPWYAAVVIALWVVGMLALGAWRTVTRDA